MANINQGVLDGVRRIGLAVRLLAVNGQHAGATLGFRLMGATQSGAPSTGTWKTGDETRDRSGRIWICTAGGSPGTWAQSGLLPASNLSDLASASTARTNLGLGTAATAAIDTTAADIAALGTQAAGATGKVADGGHVHPATGLLLSSTLTTLGDILYENATPAAARLAGNTSATKNFLTQTGNGTVSAAPAWGTIAAADMPAGTTSAQGALQLDGTATDIAALGTRAAGATGKAADAGHVHPAPAASASYHPSNPTSTVSTSLVMMGLGSTCTFTPSGSGKVQIFLSGTFQIATAVQFGTLGGRYGTGTAPTNGAAVTGTRFGAAADQALRPAATGANGGVGWAFGDVLTLTAGTAYWFDLALSTNAAADAASVSAVGGYAVELVA